MKHLFTLCVFAVTCLCFSIRSNGQTVYNNPGFSTGTGLDSYINSSAKQPDGKLLIGGSFMEYNGTAVSALCRLFPDGSIDSSFHFNTSNGMVAAIQFQSDGKIIIGGHFDEWDGVVRNHIARLNADGTLDLTFDPGDGFESLPGSGYSYVYDLKIQSDGKIIAVGTFELYHGIARKSIARINSDGTPDTSYDPGSLIESGTPAVAELFSCEIQPDGKLLLAGNYMGFNSAPTDGLLRLNTDGTRDMTFAPTFDIDGLPGYGSVLLYVKLQPDNKVLLGGYFTEVNGTPSVSIARLTSSGAVDNSFLPPVLPSDFTGAGSVAQVFTIALQDDGKILLGGSFDTLNSLPTRNIARLMPDGSPDYGFDIQYYSDLGEVVYALLSLGNSSFLAGGAFETIQGEPNRFLAKLDVCGTFSVTEQPACGDYYWSTGDSTYAESGTYFARLSNSEGCDSVAVLQLAIPDVLDRQELCIIGLDSLTNHNRVVWEKPFSSAIDSFYVYRESTVAGIYTRIGGTDYSETGVFIDANSNPAIQPYRYKVSIIDTCGRETELSFTAHKTIHLTINQGTGTTWNLIWSSYEGIAVPSYNIYRGTDPAAMTLLTTVQGSINSYSDLNAPADVFYQIGFINPDDCDPSKTIDYNTSKSNISATNPLLALDEETSAAFTVFPNPAEDELTVLLPASTGTIAIYSLIGNKVFEQTIDNRETTFDIQALAKGMYMVVFNSGKQVSELKFVKK